MNTDAKILKKKGKSSHRFSTKWVQRELGHI